MRTLTCVLAVAVVSFMANTALAGDVDDTVFLRGGGRVRGTVISEEPGKGVTLKLPDGTTRVLAANEIDHVAYGAAAAPAPGTPTAPPWPPAFAGPAAVPLAAAPAPPPQWTPERPYWQNAPPRRERQNPGLFAGGIVMVSLGGVGTVGTAVVSIGLCSSLGSGGGCAGSLVGLVGSLGLVGGGIAASSSAALRQPAPRATRGGHRPCG